MVLTGDRAAGASSELGPFLAHEEEGPKSCTSVRGLRPLAFSYATDRGEMPMPAMEIIRVRKGSPYFFMHPKEKMNIPWEVIDAEAELTITGGYNSRNVQCDRCFELKSVTGECGCG